MGFQLDVLEAQRVALLLGRASARTARAVSWESVF